MKSKLLLLLFLALTSINGFAQDNKEQKIHKLIDSIGTVYLSTPTNTGIVIGVINNGKRLTQHFGGKYIQSQKNIDSTTLFEIGSVTKLYISFILAALETEGKIKRSDLLSKYLPKSVIKGKAWANQIKLADLSTHTSGLPGYDDTKSLKNLPEFDEDNPFGLFNENFLLSLLSKTDTLVDYGKVRYSNFGVSMLGYAMAKSQKTSFEHLFQTYITEKLALKDTYLSLSEDKFTQLAVPHRKGEVMPLIQLADLSPAGSIKTSINGLLDFLQVHIVDNHPAKSITNITLSDQLNGKPQPIGLGWGIHNIEGQTVYFHNGGTYGSSSIVIIVPEKHLAVAILANDSTDGQLTSYALKLVKELVK